MSAERLRSPKDALIRLGLRRGRGIRERPLSLQTLASATFSSSALSFSRSSTRHSGVKQPLRSTVIKHPLRRGDLGTCTCHRDSGSRGTCAPRDHPARPACAHAHFPSAPPSRCRGNRWSNHSRLSARRPPLLRGPRGGCKTHN